MARRYVIVMCQCGCDDWRVKNNVLTCNRCGEQVIKPITISPEDLCKGLTYVK